MNNPIIVYDWLVWSLLGFLFICLAVQTYADIKRGFEKYDPKAGDDVCHFCEDAEPGEDDIFENEVCKACGNKDWRIKYGNHMSDVQ